MNPNRRGLPSRVRERSHTGTGELDLGCRRRTPQFAEHSAVHQAGEGRLRRDGDDIPLTHSLAKIRLF